MARLNVPVVYFVDEKRGIVVAKLEDVHEEIFRIVGSALQKGARKANILPGLITLGGAFNSEYLEKKGYRKTIVAKATCNFEQGDVFDLEFGKKLAYERAVRQFNYLVSKLLFATAKEIEYLTVAIETQADFYAGCESKTYDRIDGLIEDSFE